MVNMDPHHEMAPRPGASWVCPHRPVKMTEIDADRRACFFLPFCYLKFKVKVPYVVRQKADFLEGARGI